MRVAVIGSAFEIMLFNCGGAKGTRTPGLLHAIQGESVWDGRLRSVSRTSGHINSLAMPAPVRRNLGA
jgi:hypothetical protein